LPLSCDIRINTRQMVKVPGPPDNAVSLLQSLRKILTYCFFFFSLTAH
jgi:hypothetical protein